MACECLAAHPVDGRRSTCKGLDLLRALLHLPAADGLVRRGQTIELHQIRPKNC